VHEQVYDVKVDGNSTKNILVWRQRKLVVAAHEHLEEQKKTAHVCEVSQQERIARKNTPCGIGYLALMLMSWRHQQEAKCNDMRNERVQVLLKLRKHDLLPVLSIKHSLDV